MAIQPSLTKPPQHDEVGVAGEHVEPLACAIAQTIAQAGGWMGFDRFMALALYAPGLGYYTRTATQLGALPLGRRDAHGTLGSGSDFVTAPELTTLFGHTLAQQVAQALQATGTREIWEFGSGTGALALQLLDALAASGQAVDRYTIVDLSGSLKERQRLTLARHAPRVHWAAELPREMHGVVVGNEVLDAMPVQLLARVGGVWLERGVALAPALAMQEGKAAQEGEPAQVDNTAHAVDPTQAAAAQAPRFVWADRPTALRPPVDVQGDHDYLTEIHPQAEAFVRTLAELLQRGAVFLLDYGFPEGEYYHPQRHMGTVMCHRAHQADSDPLSAVGYKDITAHVNFTGLALAAQDAGLEVLGYTSQAHFLINCGLAQLMQAAPWDQRAAAQRLLMEHEMGELFKVIGFAKGSAWDALGFAQGDRSHRL
jgi:SAM-dependent MidA family methyltransferase